MVNLPDREGNPLTGASAWAREQMDRMQDPNPIRRLRLVKINYHDDGNGLLGEIELVDDNGIIFKTATFPVPVGLNLEQQISYTQAGDEVRIRCEDGTSFHVRIEETRYENPERDIIERMSLPATNGGLYTSVENIRLFMSGENNYFGRSEFTKKKKTIKLPKNMKCAFCNEHIHNPDKLVQLLGEGGTKEYLKYCKKSKTKPQLFCCECYSFIEDKPKIYGALNTLNKQLKKFVDINKREKEITQREKELDKQLRKTIKYRQ